MASIVKPHGLGEVVLRVRNISRAIAFYRDIIGLEVLQIFDDRIAFLSVDVGHEGHERIIGLFRTDQPSNRVDTEWQAPDAKAPTLHHFAIEISLADFDEALTSLTTAGLNPNTAEHPWIGWRSIYVTDPDGHIVELVAVDPSIRT